MASERAFPHAVFGVSALLFAASADDPERERDKLSVLTRKGACDVSVMSEDNEGTLLPFAVRVSRCV
jgi:hypothetical protein